MDDNTNPDVFKIVRELIHRNQLREAIEVLSKYPNTQPETDEYHQKLSELEKQHRLNHIQDDEFNVEVSRLSYRIMQTAQQLESANYRVRKKKFFARLATLFSRDQFKKHTREFIIGLLVTVIGGLMLAFVLDYIRPSSSLESSSPSPLEIALAFQLGNDFQLYAISALDGEADEDIINRILTNLIVLDINIPLPRDSSQQSTDDFHRQLKSNLFKQDNSFLLDSWFRYGQARILEMETLTLTLAIVIYDLKPDEAFEIRKANMEIANELVSRRDTFIELEMDIGLPKKLRTRSEEIFQKEKDLAEGDHTDEEFAKKAWGIIVEIEAYISEVQDYLWQNVDDLNK